MLICAETATSILAIKLFQYFTPDPELDIHSKMTVEDGQYAFM